MKIAIIGDASVGKTCWIRSLGAKGSTSENSRLVISTELGHVSIGGTDRLGALEAGEWVFVVYDVTNWSSFQSAFNCVEDLPPELEIVLVGNKIDLPNREVSIENAKNHAALLGVKHFEISALTGEGVLDPIQYLIR